MGAVLTDKDLFTVFLSMLSSKRTSTSTEGNDQRGRSGSFGQMKLTAKAVQSTPLQIKLQQLQFQSNSGRKRKMSCSSADDASLSLLTPNASKNLKMMKSPIMQQQGKEYMKVPLPNSSLGLPSIGAPSSQSLLDINFSVVAAVIFYSVFRHLDQWPAIFVRM